MPSCRRVVDRNGVRSAEVRDRLEQMIYRLRDEGRTSEEIATILAGYVAAAMEPMAPSFRMGGEGSAGEPVLVNLSTVPLRFSVSAVMALYHLQASGSQPARLGETVGISAAAMTGILDTLEGRGLISRVRDPQDRRKVQVELTAEGRRMVACMFLN